MGTYNRFVERSYARVVSSTIPPVGETAADTAKMAAAPGMTELLQMQPQPPSAPELTGIDPASPAGIAQAVVTLLGTTLTAIVDSAVHRGLEQLHIEIQAQAQRITHVEERISSLEHEFTASSAVIARMTATNRDILDKLDDLENRLRRNDLCIIGLPELISAAQLTNICTKIIP